LENVKTLHNIFFVIMQLSISVIGGYRGFGYIDNIPQWHYSWPVISETTLGGQIPERKDNTCG